jgi:Caspase domain
VGISVARTALVIGSETGELSGVGTDVDVMTALLTRRGFEVDARTGADATRAGILDGYERLIASADEAAVVYYSGHGGLARVLAPDGIPLPELQFIVPTDYDASGPGDFRGITAIELSVLQSRLTERTRNVTVILDCCHSAHMSRRHDLRVKALAHPTYLDVAEHIGMLKALGLPEERVDPVSNPYAVRLVACAPWESAYEYTNNDGVRIGIATDSLRIALAEAGTAKVTWTALVQRIRGRVSTLFAQRPEVEGPAGRVLFEVEEARTGSTFGVARPLPDRLSLPGAALLGVGPGDEFAITAAGVAVADGTTTVARATVNGTDGITVHASFELCEGHQDLPPVAEAHPLVTSAVRHAVAVRGDGPLADRIRAAVNEVPTLRAPAAGEPAGTDPVIAEVAVSDTVDLWDGGTVPLVSAPADAAGLGRVVADLALLGRTAALRRLAPGPGEQLTEPFTVEWGRVTATGAQPLPASGALLHTGEPVYVRLRNDSDRDLFFFVFDLGVGGAVTLVTAADPSGLRVEPKQEHVVGESSGGVLKGSPLVWPAGVPVQDPRPETLLVIVTSTRQDLSALAHEGVHGLARGASSLQRAVDAAMGGGRRDWSTVDSQVRYAVVHLDYELSAAQVPVPETARFLVDERPGPSTRLLQPRGMPRGAVPAAVAVRLAELVVHRNRALGGADVRVDALVLTGGGGNLPVYRAQTARFSNIRDETRLPMDNLLVYHGPAVDYLDLAWWVSRDRRGSLALGDLLSERLNAEEVRTSLESLSALAIGAPHAALAVAAVSACAIIVNTAYKLLSTVVGDSIGLYRTSLLASEGFGVGRHPVTGTRHAQDFSFAYEIVRTG